MLTYLAHFGAIFALFGVLLKATIMRWCTTIDKHEVWILASIAQRSWTACAFNRGSPRHALIHVISHIFSTCTYLRTETHYLAGSKIATNFSQIWPNTLHSIVPGLCRKGCPRLNTCVQLNLVIGFTACCYVCKYIVYIAHIVHRVLKAYWWSWTRGTNFVFCGCPSGQNGF